MKIPALASAIALALTVSGDAQDRTNSLGNGVAPMATTDPQIMLYRVAGVRNTAEANASGISTIFFCHSNSSTSETLRIRLFNYSGAIAADYSAIISPKRTLSFPTHITQAFVADGYLAPAVHINQGAAAIISTSKEIFCSAMIVDAAAAVPSGISLHMVRFNPAPGSVE